LTVDRVEADVTLESLWSGHPHITELAIVRPVAHVPLLRQRNPQALPSAKPAAPSGEDDANAPVIDHVTVTDGAIEFFNARDRVDDRIDGINADVVIGGDRKIRVAGRAHASEHPLKFEIKATMPAPPVARQNIPVDLVLDMPGVLQSPASGRAEVRLNGSIVMINGLSGTIGDDVTFRAAGEPARQRETQARSRLAVRAPRVAADPRLEDPFSLLLGDSGSVVLNRVDDGRVLTPDRDSHAARAVATGVFEYRLQNAIGEVGVEPDP
jgi:uncharacterized protein involved in outer membrane biogenesis